MPEAVRCIFHNIGKPKMFGRVAAFNVAVTESRCIFARMTDDSLKKAMAEEEKKGKQEGKGFFSRWGDQIGFYTRYADRYLTMSADEVLKDNSENFAVAVSNVKSVSFKVKEKEGILSELSRRMYGEVIFDTDRGKLSYQMYGTPEKDIACLREVLGERVRS